MRIAALLWVAIVVAGCGSSTKVAQADVATQPTPAPTASLPADANEAVREQLRSGLFQLSAALDSIQEALKQAKEIQKGSKGRLKEAMSEVVDRIDSCGSTLADHNSDPPTVDDVKKDFAKFDDQRLKTVDDVNDTLSELKEIKGMVGGLTGDTPELEDKLTRLAALVDQAMEDASGTLLALGGKEQLPTSVPTSP